MHLQRFLSAMCLVVATLSPAAPPVHAADQPRRPASQLPTALAGMDSVSARNGYVVDSGNVRYERGPAAYAVYEGGGENGFARAVEHVDWQVGETVLYSASLLLPPGFHDAVEGQVDILRWDDWPSHPRDADWGGISIWEDDREARLLRFAADRPEDVLGQSFSLPEGRWFRLEVRQRLTSGQDAFSLVLVDGEIVAWSEEPTTFGRPVERMRFGLVAIADGAQQRPLELFMADPEARTVPAAEPPWQRAADGVARAVEAIGLLGRAPLTR